MPEIKFVLDDCFRKFDSRVWRGKHENALNAEQENKVNMDFGLSNIHGESDYFINGISVSTFAAHVTHM